MIYSIPLLPYLKLREEAEVIRASRARTKTKVKKIPARFVSVNDMYPINRFGHGVRLSDEGRIYKAYIYDELAKQVGDAPSFEYYDCTYVFYMTHEMMFTGDDEMRRIDVSNMLKAAEDAVFEFLLEDDSKVLSIHGFKRLTLEDPRLVVTVSMAQLGDPITVSGGFANSYELEHGKVLYRGV